MASDNLWERFAYLSKQLKPHGLVIGDLVEVIGQGHAFFGQSGKITKVDGQVLSVAFDSQTAKVLARDVRCLDRQITFDP